MNKTVRFFLTIFLLLMYINRGFFFFFSVEMNNPDGEINSVVEYIVQLITGEDNGIDEDGDMQTECNFVQIVQHDFSQQLAQSIELQKLFSKEIEKFRFPLKEDLPIIDFFSQLEQPPEC
jgi:hypothetical protein